MTVLVACETVLLALLVLLVAGLLRSHAEILRRLGPPSGEGENRGAELPSPARRATIREGNDIIDGRRPPQLPAKIRVMAVTKDPTHESSSRLRSLAPQGTPVVMSSAAWNDYGVPAAPYFVYIEGGAILGEGSANGWAQISSLVRDAIDDFAVARGGQARPRDVD